MLTIEVPNHGKMILRLILLALLLMCLSTIAGLLLLKRGAPGFLELLYVNSGNNVQKWYDSVLLSLCGVLLYLIAQGHEAWSHRALSWRLLAFTFFFLSLSKATSFDQSFFGGIRRILSTVGVRINPFLFGVLLIVLFLLFFAPFFAGLSRRVKKYFILSVIVYVLLSLFFEVLSSYLYRTRVLYVVFSGFEELCEMIGGVIFLYALLLQLEEGQNNHPSADRG